MLNEIKSGFNHLIGRQNKTEKPEIGKQGSALNINDTVSLRGEENVCTPEIRNKIGSLIAKAYSEEDDWKMGLGMTILTGFATAGMIASGGSGIVFPVAGAILTALFGYATKVGDDAYKSTVKEIQDLDKKYHCGVLEPAKEKTVTTVEKDTLKTN